MALPVVFRRRVRADLASAYGWYEAQRPGLGAEFLGAITACFGDAGANPFRFAAVHGDVRRAMANRFPYAVFFVAESQRVVVLRVLHTARDPALWPKAR